VIREQRWGLDEEKGRRILPNDPFRSLRPELPVILRFQQMLKA
jgi:hypothetical protein